MATAAAKISGRNRRETRARDDFIVKNEEKERGRSSRRDGKLCTDVEDKHWLEGLHESPYIYIIRERPYIYFPHADQWTRKPKAHCFSIYQRSPLLEPQPSMSKILQKADLPKTCNSVEALTGR